MRKRYVSVDGHWVPYEEAPAAALSPMIQGEIKPFRSMVDGSVIESRKQYENQLKRHGMRVVDPSEVQTEKILNYQKNYDVAPEQRRELIRAQIDAMPHKEFKAALQRDIDNARWNSRK